MAWFYHTQIDSGSGRGSDELSSERAAECGRRAAIAYGVRRDGWGRDTVMRDRSDRTGRRRAWRNETETRPQSGYKDSGTAG